jgi:hypothetical protein
LKARPIFGNAPTLGEPVVGFSTTNKKAAKTTKPTKKDVVPKFMGNYFRLNNCLFHPALREQYALFNCQPNKDVLTRKKVANRELCKKILVMYNGDNAAADSLDDEWDKKFSLYASTNRPLQKFIFNCFDMLDGLGERLRETDS